VVSRAHAVGRRHRLLGLSQTERPPAGTICASAGPARLCLSLLRLSRFGFSDGERGRLVPEEQVEDIRAAVDYLQHREETAASPVILLGWGLGRW
jgi:hypothetical protein